MDGRPRLYRRRFIGERNIERREKEREGCLYTHGCVCVSVCVCKKTKPKRPFGTDYFSPFITES